MKAVIYLRTSTREQHPEKQRDECITFAKQRGYEVVDVFMEKVSGYKKVERPLYNKVKELAHQGKINAVIVWALDRWVRDRDTLIEDVTTLRNYNVKLHSVRESWLESINIEGSMGRTITEFLLGLVGTLAQMESERKAERTHMAYQSYLKEKKNNKNKKWGRRKLPERVVQDVLDLHRKGIDMRSIAEEVTYYDKNRNKKNISLGAVHKIIKNAKQ